MPPLRKRTYQKGIQTYYGMLKSASYHCMLSSYIVHPSNPISFSPAPGNGTSAILWPLLQKRGAGSSCVLRSVASRTRRKTLKDHTAARLSKEIEPVWIIGMGDILDVALHDLRLVFFFFAIIVPHVPQSPLPCRLFQ